MNEVVTWSNHDKHYQSYAVLLNERSQQMARLLGIVDDAGASQIHRDVRCLACHTSTPVNQMGELSPHQGTQVVLAPGETKGDARVNLGVSCEGCHGPAGAGAGGPGWETAHTDWRAWRKIPSAERFEKFGYWDVHSPVTRTQICVTCHVGNVAEGKVVTHEMYAAGHPPLPAFELAAFLVQEPPHWRTLQEKDEQLVQAYLGDRGEPPFDPQEMHRTKEVLIAALVTLGESMKLSADLGEGFGAEYGARWPELANFACYACHHDLRYPGWRQARYGASRQLGPQVPGRPALHEWTMVLAEVAAKQAGKEAELQALLQEVWASLSRQPFGDESLGKSLVKLATATHEWALELERQPLQREQALDILNEICRLGEERAYDYDSARQLVWAFERIYSECKPAAVTPAPRLSGGPAPASSDYPAAPIAAGSNQQWLGHIAQPDGVEQLLKPLGDVLVLDLRFGRRESQLFEGEDRERPQVQVQLGETLPRIAAYEPEQVRQAFKKLKAALPRE